MPLATADSAAETPNYRFIGGNFLEAEGPQLNPVGNSEYNTFPVVLDLGAAGSAVDIKETPGYKLQESAGSKSGSCFIAVNGERIANRREANWR